MSKKFYIVADECKKGIPYLDNIEVISASLDLDEAISAAADSVTENGGDLIVVECQAIRRVEIQPPKVTTLK